MTDGGWRLSVEHLDHLYLWLCCSDLLVTRHLLGSGEPPNTTRWVEMGPLLQHMSSLTFTPTPLMLCPRHCPLCTCVLGVLLTLCYAHALVCVLPLTPTCLLSHICDMLLQRLTIGMAPPTFFSALWLVSSCSPRFSILLPCVGHLLGPLQLHALSALHPSLALFIVRWLVTYLVVILRPHSQSLLLCHSSTLPPLSVSHKFTEPHLSHSVSASPTPLSAARTWRSKIHGWRETIK